MPVYKAPVEDVMFLLEDVLEIGRYNNLPGFEDVSPETLRAILAEGAKLSASEAAEPELHEVKAVAPDPEIHLAEDEPTTGGAPTSTADPRPALRPVADPGDDDGPSPDVAAAG